MFRMHRTFEVRAGQGREARAYLADVSAYIGERYSVPCQAFIEVFGPHHVSHLMIDFDDMASLEEFWQQLGPDDDFGAIQARETDIVIDGTVRQALLADVV